MNYDHQLLNFLRGGRGMKNAGLLKSFVFLGTVASFAQGTVLLSDIFSSCAETSLNWALSHPDSMVATCGNGEYSIQNKQKGAAGLVIHAFQLKPATITASVKISRTGDSVAAGFFICMRTAPSFAGYSVQLYADQSLQVYKFDSTGSREIYFNTSSYIVPGAASNVVKVSKTGNRFYLFCNDHFIDSITDAANPLANGDFALLVPRTSTVKFDDILITDLAATISSQNCFKDGFSDNSTYPWGDFKQNSVTQEVPGQYLSISTMADGAYDYHYTDIKLDTFVSKTIVSYRKGKTSSLYGFFFKGKQIDSAVPMAFFAFNAKKQYDAYIDTINLPAIGSTFIKGPPYIDGADTTYFWDTLQVVKTSNSRYYKMFVNNVLLDSLSDAKANFAINGVGVFCDDSLVVYIDSISVESGICSPVVNVSRNLKLLRKANFNPSAGEYLIDPLGRKLRVLNYNGSVNRSSLAPGFYISNTRKSGVVVRKK